MNDGACDRQGRFIASSMSLLPGEKKPTGACWRLNVDLTAGERIEIRADIARFDIHG